MRTVAVCVLALLAGVLPPAGAGAQTAQSGGSGSPGQPSPPAVTAEQTRASAAAVSSVVSLDRIKRGLRQPAPVKTGTPLKLEYYVEVLGVAPPFTLFEADDLGTGRIPYSAPSYADMRAIMTPIEYRAPVVSFSKIAKSGARSILDRSAARARARRVEDARRKALEAERERQQLLKETVVASPPK